VTALDRIEISAVGFGGGLSAGDPLAAGRLVAGTAATDGVGQFLYDAVSGRLQWDADGTGAGLPDLVAVLTGAPDVSASDFVVII
jgi:hypothetical protein